jgi:hypothetical protein
VPKVSAREVAKESGFNIEKVVLIDVVVLSVRRIYCVQDSTVKYPRADRDDNELAKKILRFRKWNRNRGGPVGRVVLARRDL